MALPRPTNVEIGGKSFKISIVPQLMLHEEMQNCVGICRIETQQIKLIPCLTVERQEEILYHEILEGINAIWFADKLEHDEIYRLGQAWCQAMRSIGVTFDWSECLP